MALHEVNDAADVIYGAVDPNANIIFGSVVDEKMGDELQVTVIATGFHSTSQSSSLLNATDLSTKIEDAVAPPEVAPPEIETETPEPAQPEPAEPIEPEPSGTPLGNTMGDKPDIDEIDNLDVPTFLRKFTP